MKAKNTRQRSRSPSRSFLDCLREFLTPAVWKQAQQQRRSTRRSSRWSTQPLVLVLLLMTWCCGDSQPERFEIAKGFCIVCLPKRRRPGKTVQGFQKALAKLPMGVLRFIAAGIRQTLAARLAARWYDEGFIGIGCDGSRVECPRTTELEQRLGQASKDGESAYDLGNGSGASASGAAVGVASGQGDSQRTSAPDADVEAATGRSVIGRRRRLLRLRLDQAAHGSTYLLPAADVFERDAVYGRESPSGTLSRGVGLLLARARSTGTRSRCCYD